MLSVEQKAAVEANGHVIVTACPGSGKTRVLTHRVLRGLSELKSPKERVIAFTFTNRAADEIQHRLDGLGVSMDRLWTGTIHAFALEWILRPYAPYSSVLRNGFSVADEHYTDRLLAEGRKAFQADDYLDVRTAWPRSGKNPNQGVAAKVFEWYKSRLRSERLLDYDDVLFFAFWLVSENQEISQTLAALMPLICIDEVQDIQDLQYAILAQIVKNSGDSTTLFFVGDENQSIYESLGALTKTPEAIAAEFQLSKIVHLSLSENYRSTQRIVDYCRLFRPKIGAINAMSQYAAEQGRLRFFDQSVHQSQLAKFVGGLVKEALDAGASASDICIVAPRWFHVIPLARALMAELPEVDFDAPGLSPLHSANDDVWFKLARLLLTEARHSLDRTRHRWAADFILSFESALQSEPPESLREPRQILRFVNSISSPETEGLAFLRDSFSQFLLHASVELDSNAALKVSYNAFFEKAENRIKSSQAGMPTTVSALRRLFKSPAGVVVNTCHGVKGEEYDTVIALGLLHGFVPHWSAIYGSTAEASQDQASKLLYVVCSRAKRNLVLISEQGRQTQKGAAYQTAIHLRKLKYKYDS